MAYIKTVWKDRVVQRPRTYIESANADGSITHVPSEGTVTEAGTPVNASNLNKIENELYRLGTQDATTTQKGIVQLVDNAESTSTSLAPTANALKQINDTLKQLGGNNLGIVGYDFKSADTSLNASKNFNTISASTGNRTITLPKANAYKGGQEIIIRKHDASTNTVTVVASSGDTIDAPLTVLSTSKQILKFSSDGVSIWLNSN
jgi:hypothetical protein